MPVLIHFWLTFYLTGYSFAPASSPAVTTASSTSRNSQRAPFPGAKPGVPVPRRDLTLPIPLGARSFSAWQLMSPWGRGSPGSCVLEEADHISSGEGITIATCPELRNAASPVLTPGALGQRHVFQHRLITPNGQITPKPHPSGLILPGMQKPEPSSNHWDGGPLNSLESLGWSPSQPMQTGSALHGPSPAPWTLDQAFWRAVPRDLHKPTSE